jgi:Protein of unknown function (DUF4199)
MDTPWVKYGLYNAVLSIATFLINIYVFPLNGWIQFVIFSLSIYFCKLAIDEVRVSQGGYSTYGDAFTNIFLIFLLSLIATAIISILVYSVIDPDTYLVFLEQQKEAGSWILDAFGINNEEAMEKMEEEASKPFSVGSYVLNMIFGTIGVAILAAIVALFFRKEEKFA